MAMLGASCSPCCGSRCENFHLATRVEATLEGNDTSHQRVFKATLTDTFNRSNTVRPWAFLDGTWSFTKVSSQPATDTQRASSTWVLALPPSCAGLLQPGFIQYDLLGSSPGFIVELFQTVVPDQPAATLRTQLKNGSEQLLNQATQPSSLTFSEACDLVAQATFFSANVRYDQETTILSRNQLCGAIQPGTDAGSFVLPSLGFNVTQNAVPQPADNFSTQWLVWQYDNYPSFLRGTFRIFFD